MLGTPVVVVFFNIPVASPDKDVPFILTTVATLPTEVTSPVKFAFVVTVAALPNNEPVNDIAVIVPLALILPEAVILPFDPLAHILPATCRLACGSARPIPIEPD